MQILNYRHLPRRQTYTLHVLPGAGLSNGIPHVHQKMKSESLNLMLYARRNEILWLVMVLFVLGFAASVALAVDGDSTSWEGFYDGSVLPTADTSYKSTAWATQPDGLAFGGNTTEGGTTYLEFIEPGGAPIEARGFRREDIDQTIEASYEVRMRANTLNVHASASMDFSNIGHGSLSWSFIGDSHGDYVGDPNGHNFRLHMGAGSPNGPIVLEESVVGDFSDWHTYRVTVQRVAGVGFTLAKLYVDDNPTNLIDPNSHFGNAYQNPGANRIVVHTQDPFAEDTDIDYIRWTTAGEFAPIVVCDFDSDTLCGLADINMLMGQGDLTVGVSVGAGNQFDLNSDNTIDEADITEWLERAGTRASYGSTFSRGDTELDNTFPTVRTVDITDFQSFLVGFTGAGTSWELGNFDGNSEVDITDFSLHFLPNFSATGGGTYGPGQAIPEPSTVLLLGLGGVWLAYLACRRAQKI